MSASGADGGRAMSVQSFVAITANQLAQAAEIFQAARANAPATARPASEDFDALARFHLDEMQRIAALATTKRVIGHFAPSLLSERDRWEMLPDASRRILTAFQSAGGGQYVPNDTKGNSQ